MKCKCKKLKKKLKHQTALASDMNIVNKLLQGLLTIEQKKNEPVSFEHLEKLVQREQEYLKEPK